MDVRSINSTFKSLDWEVITHTDSTAAQIRDIILKQVRPATMLMNVHGKWICSRMFET